MGDSNDQGSGITAGSLASAAQWLGKMAVEEINYLGSARDKVDDLRKELTTLAAFLAETFKTRHQDQVVLTMISEAKEVAYECEDVIDKYILQVALHGYEECDGFQFGNIMRYGHLIVNAASVHEIGSKISKLNDRLAAVQKKLVAYGVSNRINNATSEQFSSSHRHQAESLRRIYTHQREESVVVGLEAQLEELVKRLADPSDQTVIAICGMGGVGKSTLARELYHHPELRGGCFEAFGWASASQKFQPERVLRALLYSLVPEHDQGRRSKIDKDINADKAYKALYELMKEVKCLVIIDDIWTSKDWDMLSAALPRKNAKGSRIVMSTRNHEAVSGLDRTRLHLHLIKGLDEKRSWELFENIAFYGDGCDDSMKEELGRAMLRRCKGVPLAIVVLAKVLRRRESVDGWRQIHNEISTQIGRGGVPDLYKEVHEVLQVSYDELPVHLKQCFLYLANFPKDYEIVASKLYQLWVAEGIVIPKDQHELEEDVAERYLNELVSRNMVQVASWVDGTKRIKTCRIHDLMRDVCIDIATKEGFLQIINCRASMLLGNETNADRLLMNSLPKADKNLRRLAVYISDIESSALATTTIVPTVNASSRAPHLRSLLIFSVNDQEDDEDCKRLMETITDDFPLLRVFNCESFHTQGMFPEKVGDLIHLRYLGLANTRVTDLPSSIERLHWLQTLDLRVDTDVQLYIPNILWKMKQLRHVYLPDDGGLRLAKSESSASDPPRYLIDDETGLLRLDGLGNLQTLLSIDLDRIRLGGIKELKRLTTVKADCETKGDALYLFLEQCTSIKSFELRLHAKIINEDPTILSGCEVIHQLQIHAEPYANFRLVQQLRLHMLPKSLVSLGIWYLKLDYDPLPVLEKLPNLVNLRLIMCYAGQRMICSAGGFPELTTLCFYGLRNFTYWDVMQGALQKLQSLLIIGCRVMKIPRALPSSVNVTIHGTR